MWQQMVIDICRTDCNTACFLVTGTCIDYFKWDLNILELTAATSSWLRSLRAASSAACLFFFSLKACSRCWSQLLTMLCSSLRASVSSFCTRSPWSFLCRFRISCLALSWNINYGTSSKGKFVWLGGTSLAFSKTSFWCASPGVTFAPCRLWRSLILLFKFGDNFIIIWLNKT